MASPIRFTGMASGLDTEKIIKDLMKVQREPVNRLQRQKQLDEWKRDAYREMNSLLDELKKAVDSLRYAGNFNKKVASSENDGIVSAKVVGTPSYATYVIEVKQLAKAEMPAAVELTVDSSITSKTSKIGGTDFTFEVNGKEIEVKSTDTINDVITKVKNADAGVEANFVNGKLLFTSKTGATLEGGDSFSVKVTNDGDGSKLGMDSTGSSSSKRIPGQQAEVVINGVTYTSSSNTFSFDGVEFTFKQENLGAPINVSTKTDEDAVFNMIKGFVDKYNEVIEKINKKISEPKYKGYQPLLDEEKEALPEKTAEKLENMARSGILLRDPILKNGLDELRRAISSPLQAAGVNTAFDTLSEIGIGGPPSGKYAYQENGRLYIDETKLRNAIRNNGEDVLKLFTNYSSSTDQATKYKESGIAERLFDQLKQVTDRVTKEAGSTTSPLDDSYLGRKIKDTDEEIERWEDRLKTIEDRYWKQFTAMEQAMAKAQSQGSWFAQMLGQQ